MRCVPALDAHVVLPAGRYELGERGEERAMVLEEVAIGRFPVVNAEMRRCVQATGRSVSPVLRAKLADPALADHPVTDVTRADAEAFCRWASAQLGRRVRLPTGDEWEAAARGGDGRAWPWGETFDPDLCDCSEAGWGWTVPVDAHPDGASPIGAEQMSGNVWEWVDDRLEDGWGVVRGGCYLDHAWGVRAARALPADPDRATATTGLRVVIEPGRG